MSELAVIAFAVVANLIGAYLIGRSQGHDRGYERGKEMWGMPGDPSDIDLEEAKEFCELARKFQDGKLASVQRRESDDGTVTWVVQGRGEYEWGEGDE